MTEKSILVEKEDHITIITINRPKVMNSLDPGAHIALGRAFDGFADDPEAYVAILTAAGNRVFCAGNDLQYQQKHGSQAIIDALETVNGGFGGITTRFDCFKPVIAAVNGAALGGGTEIALACDIIIAAETAQFGLPEPKVGLFAGAGGLHRLLRRIPYHLAMGYALTGRPISPQKALEVGLVNEVVPLDDLIETAKKWAGEIIQCAPLSVRASKQMMLQGLGCPLEEAVQKSYPLAEAVIQSEDLHEGIRAFIENRRPNWQGK
jgi:crotonobetainyl-CoA hydratase